jgi:succinate dehydrogenase flavin-adding protein (antitoxin of CptAB toxin-antitoxin module)
MLKFKSNLKLLYKKNLSFYYYGGLKNNFCTEEFPAPKFKTNLTNEMETAKKQIFWRVRNIGQLELEYIIMKWYNSQNLSLEELRQFSEEILEMENPEMNRYFVMFEPAPDNLVFTKKIQKFMFE